MEALTWHHRAGRKFTKRKEKRPRKEEVKDAK